VNLGLVLPITSADPGVALAAAARAADAGYDGVFSADHLIPPGRQSGPTLEVFSILSAVAATVPGISVGTLVARVSLRPPGLLAKQASMLDHLSGGRAILGLGTGDKLSAHEHEAFGIELQSASVRRALLEETANACRALFAGTAWAGGDLVPPMTGPLLPPGSPAIWIGGTSDAAVDIAGRAADAWNGWALDLEGFRTRAERLRAAPRAPDSTWAGIVLVGEDRADLERLLNDRRARGRTTDGVWTGTRDELRAFAGDLEGAGATWFIALVSGPPDRLDLVAEALGQ
jgi:alkanesulfonate monooxygenase SsuD/methylene tetrahydromethanopterin reductase-like flavin-dependent oxidoreductase (luciferase family)